MPLLPVYSESFSRLRLPPTCRLKQEIRIPIDPICALRIGRSQGGREKRGERHQKSKSISIPDTDRGCVSIISTIEGSEKVNAEKLSKWVLPYCV